MLAVQSSWRGVGLIVVHSEIAVSMSAPPAFAYLMVIDWVLNGNGVSTPRLWPLKSLLE